MVGQIALNLLNVVFHLIHGIGRPVLEGSSVTVAIIAAERVPLMWFMWVVLGTSLWVLIDANSIGVKKGQVSGIADMGPGGWFFACLLLWIVGFPMYLVNREKFKAANAGTAAVAIVGGSTAVEIERLVELRKSGVLTDEEFQAQKAKVLAR